MVKLCAHNVLARDEGHPEFDWHLKHRPLPTQHAVQRPKDQGLPAKFSEIIEGDCFQGSDDGVGID
jgi:hypothetical protein